MATESNSDPEKGLFAVGATGQLTKEEVKQLIDQVGDGQSIRSIRLEIEADQPIEQARIGLSSSESGEERSEQIILEDEPVQEETETESSSETEESSEDEAEGSESQAPRLHVGGDPFHVMQVLDARGSWMRKDGILEEAPDDWDINTDTVGTTLWNLADRDLVDTRPFEEDKRKNEYRITDVGREAVDKALERAEEQEQVLESGGNQEEAEVAGE